jgi:hypothetical protein
LSSVALPTPAFVERLERRALPVAGLGLLACGIGLLTNPDQFYRSWLFAFLYWTGMSVGCLSILAISHLTGGMWGLLIRRFLEAGTRLFPLLALLFLPVAAGLGRLYPWTHPGQDSLLLHKSLYLNVPFFLGRAAFYFAVWLLLAHFLSRWSRELDAGENRRVSRKLRSLSGGGLVLLGLTITFSAVDWGMSLNPHWFSHIYGILFMVGQALSALALMIVCVARTADEKPVQDAVRPGTVQDLGKLMLAFTMLWAYVNLSQFLIIWAGNISEETPFFIRRFRNGWQYVSILLFVFHFVFPFLLLLSRDLKRSPRLLGGLAAFMLVVRLVDLYWLVGPDLLGHGPRLVRLSLHWLDVAAVVGVGGLWLLFFARQLRTRPVLPVGEPEMAELLAARAGGR